jgi:hypothetical protein
MRSIPGANGWFAFRNWMKAVAAGVSETAFHLSGSSQLQVDGAKHNSDMRDLLHGVQFLGPSLVLEGSFCYQRYTMFEQKLDYTKECFIGLPRNVL